MLDRLDTPEQGSGTGWEGKKTQGVIRNITEQAAYNLSF